jgi:hypothetical protein
VKVALIALVLSGCLYAGWEKWADPCRGVPYLETKRQFYNEQIEILSRQVSVMENTYLHMSREERLAKYEELSRRWDELDAFDAAFEDALLKDQVSRCQGQLLVRGVPLPSSAGR